MILSSRFKTSSKRTEVAYARGHLSINAGINAKVLMKYATYIKIITESTTLSVSKPMVNPELTIAKIIKITAYKPHINICPI